MDRTHFCHELLEGNPRKSKLLPMLIDGRVRAWDAESWLCYGPSGKFAFKVMLSRGSSYGHTYYCTCGQFLVKRGCVHVEAVKLFRKLEEICQKKQLSLFPVSR